MKKVIPETLIHIMRSRQAALVALSGGVDSTLLSFVAQRALGKNARSVTVVSEFFISEEKRFVDAFVGQYQIDHEYLRIQVIGDERIASNPEKRCYYCKRAIFETLTDKAHAEGYNAVFDGTNIDDLDEDRPGIQALHELGVVSPYIEARIGKEAILELARGLGLGDFIRPSNTCLATRVTSGITISEKILEMIERAEAYLHERGFEVVRVRYHEGGIARIEVLPEDFPKVLDTSLYGDLGAYFRHLGFKRISVDIDGYIKKR
jgi:uncharacterized protein